MDGPNIFRPSVTCCTPVREKMGRRWDYIESDTMTTTTARMKILSQRDLSDVEARKQTIVSGK